MITKTKQGAKKSNTSPQLLKKYRLIASAVALTAIIGVGAYAATQETLRNQDQRASADASCRRPVLKQVVWRSGKEWFRYVPMSADKKVSWSTPMAWNDNSEYSPYPNVQAVSHYRDVLGRWLTKFLVIKETNKQVGYYFRPSILNSLVKWGNAKPVSLDLTGYPANMAALSTTLYGEDIVYKAIAYEGQTPYAYTRVVKSTGNGNYNWGASKFEKIPLEHFPGSGQITAFNEEFYDGYLTQKLVRDNIIYARNVPVVNGQPNFSNSASQWVKVVTVADSKWPGTGVVDGLSEYPDCLE